MKQRTLDILADSMVAVAYIGGFVGLLYLGKIAHESGLL